MSNLDARWTTGTCVAGDISLHYLRTGGARPPVVMLHGLTGSGACWSPVARALEADFDVVMPDARGHGQSSAPREAYAYDDHASDVVALVRQLGLTGAVLVGHSMGGMTAAVVASRCGELIGGLVLADPTFLSQQRQREVHDSDVVARHRLLLQRSKDELVAELRSRHPQRSSEIAALLAEAKLQTTISAFGVLTPPNPDYRQLVSTISVPVCIMLGDAPVLALETATQLQALNPRLRIQRIENAGHGLPYDQPERFAEAVRSFLAEVITA